MVSLLVVLSLAGGCPIRFGSESEDSVDASYVGADACVECHYENHVAWAETAHARALDELTVIGLDDNPSCLRCHTVGFEEPDGFVDAAVTPHLGGVQCENCHGPGGDHARDSEDPTLYPTIDLASRTTCANCHTGFHELVAGAICPCGTTFGDWVVSAHAGAPTAVQEHALAEPSCLACHAQDYRSALDRGIEPPTVESARLGVECVTCHAPHGGTSELLQLRKPVRDLCAECHAAAESPLGDVPHHPQLEMLEGVGGLGADGTALAESSDHSVLAGGGGQACVQCHVVRNAVEKADLGFVLATDHTFDSFETSMPEDLPLRYAGCLICHEATDAAGLRTTVQTAIADRLADLAPSFDSESEAYIDPIALSEADQARLATAKFNHTFVSADGSDGVHNDDYARTLLDIAEAIVESLQP